MGMKVEGADKVIRKLKNLENKVQNKITRKALRAGAKVIQKAEKAKAPVDSGRLKRSIKVRAMKRKKGRIGVNVIMRASDFSGVKFYGNFVIFGFKRGEKQIPANNYPKEATEASGEEAKSSVVNEMSTSIKEAWRS